jgi:3-hydroxy-D-aspartate aldolase
VLLKDQIPTPALLLDLDAFESNLTRIAREVKQAGKKLRPHAKAHKCVEIAKRQIAAGACGICVATVNEAELFAKAGIPGLLLTSPLADPGKISRMIATGAMVVVDHPRQVEWYQQAAVAANVQVPVLVDLDVGDHRTGAVPEHAIEIGLAIDRSSHLWLRGVQAYSVQGSHAANREERTEISAQTFRIAAELRAVLAHHGVHTDIASGGSTGSWDIDVSLADATELQAGSYAMMDLAYRKLGVDLAQALAVLATVVSANHEGFVTVDAGFKAFATDRGYGPDPIGYPGAVYRWGGDEFGFFDFGSARETPGLGARIEFIPPHCDPTVNLYDRIYACRGNNVEDVWPVMDRIRL